MKLKYTYLLVLPIIFVTQWFSTANAEQIIAECESQIVANKDFFILKGKLDLLNTADQPIEILGNTKTPNKTEKMAIAKWVDEYKKCSKPGIEYHKSRSVEVGMVFENAYADLYLSAADLYQGKITYGDFARGSIKRHQDVHERLTAITAKFQAHQQRLAEEKEQAEAADRQREEERRQDEMTRQQAQQRQAQALQAQQKQIQQQQQYQKQQYCESQYQQCLNRAHNPTQSSACGMGRAGCTLAGAFPQ